ncbi:MAG: S8 family peptidase [Pseudomonadota bacterium]|nr:S8 family peptidase [Pseudomonadota bacterium]
MQKSFLTGLLVSSSLIFTGCSKNSAKTADVSSTLLKPSLPSRLIIEDSNLDAVASEVNRDGGQVIRKMDHVKALVVSLPAPSLNGLKKKFPNAQISEDIIMELVDPSVSLASAKPTPGPGAQPTQSIPWGINATRANLAHAYNRGAGVKVCILDTGINKAHPDLKGNILGGKNYIMQKGSVLVDNYEDDNGHGSHVAGTIAALDNSIGALGVAPDAKLYGVKVLNRQGSGYTSDIADGVYDCIGFGASVINMSLGGSGDPLAPSPLKTAIESALANGVYVVAAAGNSGKDISTYTPAGYAGVIAVSAVDVNYAFASWSNFGLSIGDFAAPGVGIYSTWKDSGYNTISGTSMAAPHVAGVIALAVSSHSLGIVARDLGATVSKQGSGFIDALSTVLNQ